MTCVVHHGDCLEIIPTLGVTVDAVVTDPPYHLVAVHQRAEGPFAKHNDPSHPKANKDGRTAFARMANGFMGQQWDGGDIAFRAETWATIGSALRLGGFLVAFGGTRTYHRLACAIQDAGFVIQDSILDLIATDVRVQRFVETLSTAQADAFSQILDDLQPTGALAWAFASGFPKRRDMLKPGYEPIVLAYKPGGKRTMQVEECRIGTSKRVPGGLSSTENNIYGKGLGSYRQDGTEGGHDPNLGRWPANICHDGSDEVVAAFPESAGQQRDVRGTEPSATGDNGSYGHFDRVPFNKRAGEASAERRYADGAGDFAMLPGARRSDSGSAARFFFSAKADAQDRWGSRHPTVKPVELMKWLVALVTPPGGTVLDPFAGSGTTAVAALATGRNAILIEREDNWFADIRERLAFYEGGGRHSIAAKNRSRKTAAGPLFEGFQP